MRVTRIVLTMLIILTGTGFWKKNSAFALTPGSDRGLWSITDYPRCKRETGFSRFDCFLFDPPLDSGVEQIGFQLQYDSSKIQILPELSGFLCDFSSNGDCPVPGNVTGDVQLGDPRNNTTANLSVTGNTVTFIHDLSGNPTPPIVGETFFFGLAYKLLVPFSKLVPTDTPETGDIFQVSEGNFCVTVSRENKCGSTNPTFGYLVTPIPEPTSTLSLLALGTLGAVSTLKRKLKPSKFTEKETRKVG